jgi:general transcription factor 3C polypeptide 3 (transcription factor C subunit 4)
LEPSAAHTISLVRSQPQLFNGLASHLLEAGLVHESLEYYELLRAACPTATVLLQVGRCHLRLHNRTAAEELFLEAINVDEDNVDARIELATMYELAKEDEEAFILVNEALGLLAKMDLVRTKRRPYRRRGPYGQSSRHRPRRFVDPKKRMEEENARAELVKEKFAAARALRERLGQGDESTAGAWMDLAKELVDDFRYVKHFYSWDHYLRYLGVGGQGAKRPGAEDQGQNLSSMAERLSRSTCLQPLSPSKGRGETCCC